MVNGKPKISRSQTRNKEFAMPTVKKVILSNRSQLQRKYGDQWVAIESAANDLAAKYTMAGLDTQLIYVDDRAITGLGGTPVVHASSTEENKNAVDAVATHQKPSSVLLLGSTDVIPHQDLANPAFGGGSLERDPDSTAWSDLPYASDAAYSQTITEFLPSKRHVGRLPDVTSATGGNDPAYLVGLLHTARDAAARPQSDYLSYLGLSKRAWAVSTGDSLTNMFGNDTDEQLIPALMPWPAALINNRSHFINCEGLQYQPDYYAGGDSHTSSQVALSASMLPGNVTNGTVIAVECCYAADLYDPTINRDLLNACYTYLSNGAYGFFGSSTVAYGLAKADDLADLLCQYFFIHVLKGMSLGEAAFQARADYVTSHGGLGTLNALDLKTLAQFNLMGDPSLQPVQVVTPSPARGYVRPTPMSQPRPSAPRVGGAAVKQSTPPRQSNLYQGVVEIKPFAMGTKSERLAVMLVTPDHEYVLYRIGGNPIDDLRLKELAGKTLRFNGTVYGYTLFVTDWHELG
jgi:hypothetical protein